MKYQLTHKEIQVSASNSLLILHSREKVCWVFFQCAISILSLLTLYCVQMMDAEKVCMTSPHVCGPTLPVLHPLLCAF